MTNAEKFAQVFGYMPTDDRCPAVFCNICPLAEYGLKGECYRATVKGWWDSEYKGSEAEND